MRVLPIKQLKINSFLKYRYCNSIAHYECAGTVTFQSLRPLVDGILEAVRISEWRIIHQISNFCQHDWLLLSFSRQNNINLFIV